MRVTVIRTPTDMRDVMGLSFRTHNLLIPDQLEPDVRAATHGIFGDLADIPASDPALVAAYVDGIEPYLADLHTLGMQLVAVTSKGSLQIPELDDIPWSQTDFVIAPQGVWFQALPADDGLIHCLGAQCPDGHHVFSLTGVTIRSWRSEAAVDAAFEGGPPWCPACTVDAIERDQPPATLD